MAKGRRKSLTKSIVRKMKYNPPEVDFEQLENELHNQLIEPDLSATQKQKIWYKDPEAEVQSNKLSEKELEDYEQWLKSVNEKTSN